MVGALSDYNFHCITFSRDYPAATINSSCLVSPISVIVQKRSRSFTGFGIAGTVGRRVLGRLDVNGLGLEGREYGALR